MIRAVLLDLDGTLVDTVDFILASVRAAFHGDPRCPTDAQWIAGIGKPLRVQLREFVAEEELEAVVERYRAHQRAHHDASTRPYDGAVATVAALRASGRAIGIVTSKLVEPAARTLRHVGLAPHVDLLVGADTCARAKPSPDPVLHALDELGCAPAEALFAGDSPPAAGVVTVGARWGTPDLAALVASRPDHLLERLEDLPALVARLDQR